ncbi:MAG: bifunctional acetate--CoA ligase family protein/GNAT family N-acetyltransferase [Aeromicrobium sp.]
MTAASGNTPDPGNAPQSADVLLADGRIAKIRGLIAADRPGVEALFAAASEGSLYSRFFTLGRNVASNYVSHLFDPSTGTTSLIAELGGEIVGIANAETSGPAEAEVAFFVADNVHGAGVGTLLLEHLAARSRQSGIRWFVAEVLTSNLAMLRVFHDAGFHEERHLEAGVVRLRLSTAASAESLEAADAREAISESLSLKPLLYPRSVAVVGASRKPGGVGRAILNSIQAGGYSGELFAVHPEAPSIEGFNTYASFGEIPTHVDLAVIAVPAMRVMDALRDAARAGVRAAVIVSSGFGEISAEGQEEQSRLVDFARDNNMRLVGPNCLGIICNDPALRLNATFGCDLPDPGGVAVASQSGGVGIAMLDAARNTGLGIASFVSLGNKADVSGNDLIDAWIGDPGVKVAALYLESFGNPLKFARLARRFSERKPLLAIVGGRSAGGKRAGASHTAAAASPSVAIDALFAESGVIGCRSLDELVDAARLLEGGEIPAGRRVGIVSNAGGLGVLAADAAADEGLIVPELSSATRDRIIRHASGTAGVSNPIDLGAAISPEGLHACALELLDSDEVDVILVIIARTSLQNSDKLIAPIQRLVDGRPDKPIVIVRTGEQRELNAGLLGGSTTFDSTERALKAMSKAHRYGEWRQTARAETPSAQESVGIEADQLVKGILARNENQPTWLSVEETRELLGLYGINAPEGEVATTFRGAEAAASRVGLPVTIKTADPTIVHKSDLKLVISGLHTLREVHDAVEELRKRAGNERSPVLVQRHVGPGVEIALGIVRDRRFGLLGMIAAGGTATDVLRDRAFLMPPFSNLKVMHALHSLRVWPLLAGYRGEAATDVASVISLMEKLGSLGQDVPEVSEVDFNPVIVTAHGSHCVDVKIRIESVSGENTAGIPRSLGRHP